MLHLNIDNFHTQLTRSTLPVMVMFYAAWCGKCAMMKPIFEMEENLYHSGILFGEVNVDESPLLVSRYSIDIIPSFIYFKNGYEQGRMHGIIDAAIFEHRIDKLLGM